jgi:hypothetical protein
MLLKTHYTLHGTGCCSVRRGHLNLGTNFGQGACCVIDSVGNNRTVFQISAVKVFAILTCPQSPYQSEFQKSVVCKIN